MTLIVSNLQQQIEDANGQIVTLTGQVEQLQNVTQFQVTPQAVNQIYNGSYTHSVDSWDNTMAADDSRYECFYWFSHPREDGQPMYPNTTVTGPATVTFVNADFTPPTEEITLTNHPFSTGVAVVITSSAAGGDPAPHVPTPLVDGDTYYVIRVDENTIKLASTPANAELGTAITLTAAMGGAYTATLSFNYTLKEATHALYSPAFSDWSWTGDSAGAARFQGDTTIDAIIPGVNIQPGYTYYGVFNVVKQNAYITAAADERIFCGLYANQVGGTVWDWIRAPFTVTATVLGTAMGGAIEYRILARTDRGFSILSDVTTVATGPTDAEFTAGSVVFLQWKSVLSYGAQTYEIWRKRGGVYRLLQVITTGITQTLDNNSFTSTTSGGWPTGDFNYLVAYTATIPNVIDSLPYSGDPLNPQWATIPFTLKVPQNYDMSATDLESKQWLRWGFSGVTGNLDLKVYPCTVANGNKTVLNTLGLFSTTNPDMTGLTVTITSKGETPFTSTIDVVNSPVSVDLVGGLTFDSETAVMTISHGAPDHAVWVDLAHLSWVQGAAFSPAAADIDPARGIPPVAPNGTTQGGGGVGQQGGTIDGQPVCLYEEEMVQMADGTEKRAIDLTVGDKLSDGHGLTNTISKRSLGISDVWLLITEDGVTLKATDSKQIFVPEECVKKRLSSLDKGDKIYTQINGVLQESVIMAKHLLLKDQIVVQIGLTPTESFLAGGGTGKVLVSNQKPILIGGGGGFIVITD